MLKTNNMKMISDDYKRGGCDMQQRPSGWDSNQGLQHMRIIEL